MKIEIGGLEEAREDLPDHGGGIVSILADVSRAPTHVNPELPHHLQMEFGDIEERHLERLPDRADRGDLPSPPKREHAEQIVEAAPALLATGHVYCHCQAGVSRSTAAAMGLWCYHLGEGAEEEAIERVREVRPQASPNRTLVRRLDEVMGRDGRMTDVITTPPTDNWRYL